MSYAIYHLKKLYPDGQVKDLLSHKHLYQCVLAERKSLGYPNLSEYLKDNNLVYIKNVKAHHDAACICKILDEEYPAKNIKSLYLNTKLYNIVRTAAQKAKVTIAVYLKELGYTYYKEARVSEVDCSAAKRLEQDLKLTHQKVADIVGLTRQRIQHIISDNDNVANTCWTQTPLTDYETVLFLMMADEHIYDLSVDDMELYIFNDLHGRFCLLVNNLNNIKCVFIELIPDQISIQIRNERMDTLDALDYDILNHCNTINVMHKVYLDTSDVELCPQITAECHKRKMTKDEYSVFLGFAGSKSSKDKTDDDFINFFEKNLINGEVCISSDSQNQWIRTYASRAGFSLNDFVTFYGYKKSQQKLLFTK